MWEKCQIFHKIRAVFGIFPKSPFLAQVDILMRSREELCKVVHDLSASYEFVYVQLQWVDNDSVREDGPQHGLGLSLILLIVDQGATKQ